MFTKQFFKFFPPPKLLRMPSVGIDISDEAVRLIEFKQGENMLVLQKYGEKKLPAGAIEGGYVNDKLAVTTALSDLKKLHNISFVRASLPEEKAYLFQATVPTLNDKEIRENIESKLEENVPVSAADAIFDYTVISKGEKEVQVSVVVLPIKVVETYLSVFQDAGLSVVSFESEARAIAQSVIPRHDEGTYLIVNFKEKRTSLFIISNGVVRFTSTLLIGSDAITESLQKSYNISTEEALKLQYEKGFGHDSKESEDVFAHAVNALEALKDEVNKVYTYWHTHNSESSKIERIFLAGKNSMFSGLVAYLATSLKVRVSLANTWVNAFTFEKTIPPIELGDSLNYAVAIGLALPENNKQFRLLPRIEKRKLRKEYYARLVSVALMFFAFTVCFGAIFLLPSYILSRAKDTTATSHLEALKAASLKNAHPELASDLKQAEAQIEQLKTHADSLPLKKVLDVITRDRPAGLRITSINLSRTDETGIIRLAGIAPTRESLVTFNKTLRSEPMFTGVDSPVSELAKSKDIGFTLVITGKF